MMLGVCSLIWWPWREIRREGGGREGSLCSHMGGRESMYGEEGSGWELRGWGMGAAEKGELHCMLSDRIGP